MLFILGTLLFIFIERFFFPKNLFSRANILLDIRYIVISNMES